MVKIVWGIERNKGASARARSKAEDDGKFAAKGHGGLRRRVLRRERTTTRRDSKRWDLTRWGGGENERAWEGWGRRRVGKRKKTIYIKLAQKRKVCVACSIVPILGPLRMETVVPTLNGWCLENERGNIRFYLVGKQERNPLSSLMFPNQTKPNYIPFLITSKYPTHS